MHAILKALTGRPNVNEVFHLVIDNTIVVRDEEGEHQFESILEVTREYSPILVNLTPHDLNLLDEEGEEIVELEPTGQVARVETARVKDSTYTRQPYIGLPTYTQETGEIVGLPNEYGGAMYIVSGQVRAETDRADVASPGELVRDDDGRPVGAKGLTKNSAY